MQKGCVSLFWPIFILCRIMLIFGRGTFFDRKNIVPLLFFFLFVLHFQDIMYMQKT